MKKTSMIQRTVALCLLFLLVFSLTSVSAFALKQENTGSITVEGAEKGVTVTAYQLMTVNVDDVAEQPQEPAYVWVDAVAAWIRGQDNYKAFVGEAKDGEDPDNSVQEAFSSANAATLSAFYDALAAAIKKSPNGISVSPAKTETANDDGDATLADLSMGNYLVLITGGVNVYKPSTVNIVPEWKNNAWIVSTNPGTLVIKSSEPDIDKVLVDEDGEEIGSANDYNIGDTVYFMITVDIPKFPDEAISRNFVISDKLSDGLTFDATTLVVKAVGDGKDDKTLAKDTNFTQTTTNPNGNAAVTFALVFSDKAKYDTVKDYDHIVVTYAATLNKDAVVGSAGNPNNAKLDYSNNPYDANSWKTDGSIVKAYTYGIKVTKVDAKNEETKLENAQFSVKQGNTEIKFGKDSNGYYVKEDGKETPTTDANGLIVLRGLKTGTYTLTEIKAPNGYSLPQNTTFTVEIVDDEIDNGDGKTTAGKDGLVEVENAADADGGYVLTTITNNQLFTLPTTGGAGTVLFSVLGILLMAGGVALIVVILRRRHA